MSRTAAVILLVASAALPAGDYNPNLGIFGVGPAYGEWMLGIEKEEYEPAIRQRLLQVGCTSVRMGFNWPSIEPREGEYHFEIADDDVNWYAEHGIEMVGLVVNTPDWASPTGKQTHAYAAKKSKFPAVERMCENLARHFAGRVDQWEWWNEPNGYGWNLEHGYNNVDEYLPFLRAAYKGFHKGNPDCLVAIGGLDNSDGWSYIMLEKMYEAGGRDCFDAVADHPYSKKGDTENTKKKLRKLRGILLAHGDGHKPLYLTEYAWKVSEIGEEARIKAMRETFAIYSDPEFSYVKNAQYLGIGDFENPFDGFALCDVNLRPRELFYAFQGYPRTPGDIRVSRVTIDRLTQTTATITWQTNIPGTTELRYGVAAADGGALDKCVSLEGERAAHVVTIEGLKPGTRYAFSPVSARPDRSREHVMTPEAFRTPAFGVLVNAGFEGSTVGLPDGWQSVGRSVWKRVSREKPTDVHGGEYAQFVVVDGSHAFDDWGYQFVGAKPGAKCAFSAWTKAACTAKGKEDNIRHAVGIDPAGGRDPDAASVIWSDDVAGDDTWGRRTASAVATGDTVTVFFRVKSKEPVGALQYFWVDDAALSVR